MHHNSKFLFYCKEGRSSHTGPHLPLLPPWKVRLWRRPTFLCGIAHNDLASSLACLLHGQCCAQPLLVLPQTLAFPEAVLLHDFMCYCATGKKEKRRSSWTWSPQLQHKPILYHSNRLLKRESVNPTWASMWSHIIPTGHSLEAVGTFRMRKMEEANAEILDIPRLSLRQGKYPFPTKFSQYPLENTRGLMCTAIQFTTTVHFWVCLSNSKHTFHIMKNTTFF